VLDVKAVLGHASIMLASRYAHASHDGKRRAVEAISNGAGHNLVTLEKRRALG